MDANYFFQVTFSLALPSLLQKVPLITAVYIDHLALKSKRILSFFFFAVVKDTTAFSRIY